jgi:hypothetical protein
MKDFWRTSLTKAVKAVQSDSETSFIANCSLLIANLKDALGGGFVAPFIFELAFLQLRGVKHRA